MKSRLVPFLVCGVVWLLAPAAALCQPLPVKTVEFNSESVGRKMKYNIVLPANYEKSTERYPVLYLLHGLTSNYTAWARIKVPEYARAYDLIVVMPDVGNSWYVNWAKSEEGQKNNWEDAIKYGSMGAGYAGQPDPSYVRDARKNLRKLETGGTQGGT